MAKIEDFKDLTIRWFGHQKYNSKKIVEDDVLEVIVQKLEMILFTNKNDILGQDSVDLGVDIEKYLWKTTLASDVIKGEITQQINKFVPELQVIGYDLDIQIFEGLYRDMMELNFIIKGKNIDFLFR